jgi:hypothetical protein
VCLLALSIWPVCAQEGPQSPDQFFSGTIVEIDAQRITVSRTVLGKDSATRTFQITPETRIEGKPRVKSRVTVRFEGDRAVHIIVRR